MSHHQAPSQLRGPGGGPRYTRSVHMAHPLITLTRYTVIAVLFLCLPQGALSQQASPLRGQGIDPVSANASQAAVPVYLSIVLQRVTAINEVLYKYDVVLDVYMSWVDPRISYGTPLALKGIQDAIGSWTAASAACANATTPKQLQACNKAADEWYRSQVDAPSCLKPCDPANPLVCCDAVWLPDLDMPTNLGYSQDRYVKEQIIGLNNPNGMMRVVRVQGEFSNVFDFSRFPFDSQALNLPLVSLGDPSTYYLEPSFVGRYTPAYLISLGAAPSPPGGSHSGTGGEGGGGGGGGGGKGGQEITGWSISGVSLRCMPNREVAGNLNSSLLQWQEPNANDPIFQPSPPSGPSVAPPPGPSPQDRTTACTLSINVNRISSFYVWMDVVPVVLTTAIAFSVLVTAPTAIDVRLSVVVTLFLALVAVQFIIVDQLPKTAYITSFGAMVITSYTVFFALILEAVVVYYVSSLRVFHLYRTRAGERREEDEEEMEAFTTDGRDPASLDRLSSTLTRIRSSQSMMRNVRELPSGGEGAQEQDTSGHDVGKEAEGLDEGKPEASRTGKRGKVGLGRWRLWLPCGPCYQRLANDHFEGYRIACWIDWVCGPTLIIAYIITMVVLST